MPRAGETLHSQGYTQGLGGKVKGALEQTIKLAPRHADAHIALGAFHAEVIDKVGSLIGSMTYGVKKDTSLALARNLDAQPTYGLGLIKKALQLAETQTLDQQLDLERDYQRLAGRSADYREGVSAFLAKRPPQFSGK